MPASDRATRRVGNFLTGLPTNRCFPEAPMNADQATRGDVEALIALNRDYIHSVQHGDVRRFEEILAEDFLCTNPDGTLVDRRGFLAQTARPVTIGGLA